MFFGWDSFKESCLFPVDGGSSWFCRESEIQSVVCLGWNRPAAKGVPTHYRERADSLWWKTSARQRDRLLAEDKDDGSVDNVWYPGDYVGYHYDTIHFCNVPLLLVLQPSHLLTSILVCFIHLSGFCHSVSLPQLFTCDVDYTHYRKGQHRDWQDQGFNDGKYFIEYVVGEVSSVQEVEGAGRDGRCVAYLS